MGKGRRGAAPAGIERRHILKQLRDELPVAVGIRAGGDRPERFQCFQIDNRRRVRAAVAREPASEVRRQRDSMHAGEVGDFAIARGELGRILQLQLIDDIAGPGFAEGFPGQCGDGPRAEQRPQRHFDRAGIGCRHDADLVIGGNPKHLARQFDRELELGLADFRAMRTAKSGIREILGAPAGALGAWAGRKVRHVRPRSGLRCSHDLPFQIASLPLGGGVPPS